MVLTLPKRIRGKIYCFVPAHAKKKSHSIYTNIHVLFYRIIITRYHLAIDNANIPNVKYNFTIKKIDANDTGNYTCEQHGPIDGDVAPVKKVFAVTAVLLPRIVSKSAARVETKISQSLLLYCVIEAHPMDDFIKTIHWVKDSAITPLDKRPSAKDDQAWIANRTTIHHLDKQRINITLDLVNIFKKDNGSYSCVVDVPYARDVDQVFEKAKRAIGTTSVLVLDKPQVSVEFVKAVSTSQIFMNWTINDGNAPIEQYFVQSMKDGASTFTYYNHPIGGGNSSYVLTNFEKDTKYQLKIIAKNRIGMGPPYTSNWVKTLDFDPAFVPVIEVKGNTHSTITIGWHPPPANLLEFIHYYELVVAEKADNSNIIEEAIYPQNSRNLPYMFDNVSQN